MDFVAEAAMEITEVMPWNLDEELSEGATPVLLDIREPYEYDCMHIEGSINIPRGVLETACEWNYEETIPELVLARDKDIVIICRSGHRSLLAGLTMQQMGYSKIRSLKTGLRGWNDYEMPLVRRDGEESVDEENADKYFVSQVRSDQLIPS